MRRLVLGAILIGAHFCCSPCCLASCPGGPHPLYSQHAVTLNNGFLRVESPDGKKVLTARVASDANSPEGMSLSFTVDVHGRTFTTRLEGYTNGEVLWSPDSSAFAVTATNNCGATAFVYYVGDTGLRATDVHSVVERSFGMPAKCEVPVVANTGFVDWMEGSKEILVAGQVMNCSYCECMGMFKLYELSVPGVQIRKAFPQIIAKRMFRELLGCELRDANNGCADRLRHR
jgi:hypothetical protein